MSYKKPYLRYLKLYLILIFLSLLVVDIFCYGGYGHLQGQISDSIVKRHPRILDICKYAGGCQYVSLSCTRYGSGGKGVYAELSNKTIVRIDAKTIYGIGVVGNDSPKWFDRALEDAISDFWVTVKNKERDSRELENVIPPSTDCTGECK